MNARRLKYTLAIVSIICFLVYIVVARITPVPRTYDVIPGQSLKQKAARAMLYDLGQTNVGIVDGDIFSIRSIEGMSDADIGVSVRPNAGLPFEESANKTLIEKLKPQAGGDKDKVLSLFNHAYATHGGSEPWAAALPRDWPVGGARVFILAALPPLHEGQALTPALISEKESQIRNVVAKACVAAQPLSQHLAITLIGEGAAKVPRENAIPALFAGVGDAASRGRCPSKVTFVTYSEGHGKSSEEQVTWLDEVAWRFDRELESDPNNWTYQRYPRAISQFFLVAIAPMLAGLMALFYPPLANKVWWGPIAFSVIKWAAIVIGINGYTQLARGEFAPQPLNILFIAMLFGFAVPLIEWLELSKIREPPNKPTATVIANEALGLASANQNSPKDVE